MKRLTYIFLLLIIVCVGCDQGQKMVAPVMTGDVPTPQPTHLGEVETPTDPVVEEVVEAVTFDNVLDLQAGKKYKLIPINAWVNAEGIEQRIEALHFGSIYDNHWIDGIPVNPRLIERVSADAPKVWASFTLNPMPYFYTLDEEWVISAVFDRDVDVPAYDEIVIEIKGRTELVEKTSPDRRGREVFTYHIVKYEAVAIENLTHPDRKFEYE